jgi:hypothetical protein
VVEYAGVEAGKMGIGIKLFHYFGRAYRTSCGVEENFVCQSGDGHRQRSKDRGLNKIEYFVF